MTARATASRVLFWIGCLLLGGAVGYLIAAKTLPSSDGFRDLARVVGALLLAAIALLAYALALIVGRGTRMPRWMLVVCWIGVALGAIPLAAIVGARFGL